MWGREKRVEISATDGLANRAALKAFVIVHISYSGCVMVRLHFFYCHGLFIPAWNGPSHAQTWHYDSPTTTKKLVSVKGTY